MLMTTAGAAAAGLLTGAGICLLNRRDQQHRPSREALGGDGSQCATCKQHFVNNTRASSVRGATPQTINPAKQEVLTAMPTVDKADLDDVAAAAEMAILARIDVPESARCDALLHLEHLLAAHQPRLTGWDNNGDGAAVSVTWRVEMSLEIELFHFFAGWAAKDMLIMEEIKHLVRHVCQAEDTSGTESTAREAAMASLTERDYEHLVCSG